MRMPTARVLVFLLVALFAQACGASKGSVESDCTSQIRFNGRVYSSYSYSNQVATRHGVGDLSDCSDRGQDADGPTFSGEADQVDLWTFRGFPATQVLGVSSGEGSFAVYIADDVSQTNADQIMKRLDE